MVELTFELKQYDKYIWKLPKHKDMLVSGIIYGDKSIINDLYADVKASKDWTALRQIYNVACLPGLCKASLAMPDVHPGYGFPIGGVGAFKVNEGVVTVGGVGFDAGCNVATIRTPLKKGDVIKEQKRLSNALFEYIPAGMGRKGDISLTLKNLDEALIEGAKFAVSLGYGIKDDLRFL